MDAAMRLALAQINPVVGDLAGNRSLILERLADARAAGADLVLFPELAVTGYPPEDLLLRPGFVRAAERSLEEIARAARGIVAVVGTPYFERDLYNAAAVRAAGEVKAFVKKRFLPNYGVFDEFRYFAPGDGLYLFEHGETLVGVTVCEDMWQPGPPATDLALAGAQVILNISASPFHLLRDREREEMFRTRARDTASFVALCNSVGGQDELIFDGHSFVIDDEGTVLARARGFEEELLVVDIDPSSVVSRRLTDTRRRALAQDRGELREIPIEPMVEGFLAALAPSFEGRDADLTEENLQARIRGVILMALSNKFGWLLVATGNKSEMSVGYATLYGDMAGGFALLKDVFKTDVFRLSRHLNERAERELIPQSIIDRAPSAELRADQLDEDSLPPYPQLDKVLAAYVEEDRTLEELSSDGFDVDVVERAVKLIDRAEYKRRQAPPGVRLRAKAFGRDRRTPITNRWRS